MRYSFSHVPLFRFELALRSLLLLLLISLSLSLKLPLPLLFLSLFSRTLKGPIYSIARHHPKQTVAKTATTDWRTIGPLDGAAGPGPATGAGVGAPVEVMVGVPDGMSDGVPVGVEVGNVVGASDGDRLGNPVVVVGCGVDGVMDGAKDGDVLGLDVVGVALGIALGRPVGASDPTLVGGAEGDTDGAPVSSAKQRIPLSKLVQRGKNRRYSLVVWNDEMNWQV